MMDDATKCRLSAAQMSSFEENGFLAIDRLLGEEDLRPLEEEYERLLDRILRQQQAAGKAPPIFEELAFEGLAFGERFARALDVLPDLHVNFNISLPLTNEEADPARYDMHKGPALFALLRNPKILDVVEQFIGPEITSSPVQQMRMKPPEKVLDAQNAIHSNVGTTVWHQDIAALLPEADDTDQLTVWVAVTEATEENGCLLSVPGSHREGPAPHCSVAALASERQIPPAFMADRTVVPLPVGRGGIVVFHKMNIHSALPNRSKRLRWSDSEFS